MSSDATETPAERGHDFALRLGIALVAVFCAATTAAVLVFYKIQSANQALSAAGYTPWQREGDAWWWSHFVPGHIVALTLENSPRLFGLTTWVFLMLAGLLMTPFMMGARLDWRGWRRRNSLMPLLPTLAVALTVTCLLDLALIRSYRFTLDFDHQVFIPGDDPRQAVPLSQITQVQMDSWMGKHGVASSVTIYTAAGGYFRLANYVEPSIARDIRFLVISALGSGGQLF